MARELPFNKVRPSLFLAASGVLVPLAFGPWLYDLYVLPKLLVAAWLMAIAALTLFPRSASTELDYPIAVFGAVVVLSSVFSMDPYLSWVGFYKSYAGSALGWGLCGIAFLASSAASAAEKGFPNRLIRWMVLGSIPLSIYGLIQKIPLDFSWALIDARVYSTFGGPMYFGAYLVIVIPLALHLSLDGRDGKIGIVALSLAALALLATKTRSAWLGSVAGVGMLLFLRRLSGGRINRRLLPAFFAVAILCVVSVEFFAVLRTRSDIQRLEIWRSAVAIFKDHPWLGVGPDAFVAAFRQYRQIVTPEDRIWGEMNAHNDWLQVAATLGGAGVLAYLWLHIQAMIALKRSGRWKEKPTSAICGSLFAVFIYSKLNVGVWVAFFLSALLAGCLFYGGENSSKGKGWLRSSALVVLSLVIMGVCSWAAWADHKEVSGAFLRRDKLPREAAVQLMRAVELNPWETTYRQNLDSLLWDVAASSKKPEDRRTLLRWTAKSALGAIRWRPADAMAYFLLGHAELRRAVWGGEDRLEPALLALTEARRLDPGFRYIQEDLDYLLKVKMSTHRKHAMGPYMSALEYEDSASR